MDWTASMSLSDEFGEEINEVLVKAELIKARRQRDSAQNEVVRLTDQLEMTNRALFVVEQAENAKLSPPTWLSPKTPKKSAVTLVVMLSDTHFDEVVLPEEVEGLNAYNREIAVLRLNKWTENVVKLARDYLSGVTYDGIVVMLGGDIFSGDIHEELAQTNEDTMLGSLLYWAEQLSASLSLLGDEFKKVHVASVVGNHGRMTRKPRMKLRAKTNFDWLLAKMIERNFKDDKRFTFQIPEGADVLVEIYGQGHLMTHGDQVSGGGGIGGIYPPIMRMRARKSQRYLATQTNFKTLWLGHWHQYISTPSMIVNGSLKGVDEYAFINNFSFEQPQQALAIVDPQKGITIQAPVFCQDRKKEGW
jgi:hypothetical protein